MYGMRNGLMRFISYRPLLNPNTGRVLAYLSRCCIKSIIWFFWFMRKWVDASVSPSSLIHSSSYSLASILLKLTRSLSMLKNVCSRFLTLFSISRNFDRISVSFFSAKNTKFGPKLIKRDYGSLSHKNMGLSSKFFDLILTWFHASQSKLLFWLALVLRMARKLIQSQK